MKPKYEAVYQALLSRIGTMNPGDKLDSESQLAASFDVSPMTVRRALMMLNQEGLTVGKPGRGTFVVGSPGTLKNAAPAPALRGSHEDPDIRVTSMALGASDEEEARSLGCASGDFVYRVTRTHSIGAGVVGIETLLFPADPLPSLLGENLTSPPEEVLEKRYGLVCLGATTRISARLADASENAVFGQSEPCACLSIDTVHRGAQGVLCVSTALWRGDVCEFDL